MMDTQFLMSLLATPTVSGFETAGCKLYEDYLSGCADRFQQDTFGNTYAIIGSSPHFPLVMLEAHIDEIGFQVLFISEDGSVYIRRNGGVDIQCLPGSHVIVYGQEEEIPGVIGKTPIHLQTSQEREKTPELSSLWVDTGLSAEEVKNKIHIGDVVAIRPNATRLGLHRIASKALDDKIGVFIVAEVLRKLKDDPTRLRCNVQGIASVQEEVGCRGAVISSQSLLPDISISIDVDFATDTPGCAKTKYGDIRLGEGVIISLGLDSDISEARKLQKIAGEQGIPVQVSARPNATGGTNASRIRISHKNVRTILLGIPCRYMHTPVEICDLRDVQAAIDLVTAYIKQI